MKLPSLQQIAVTAAQTLQRFPFVLLVSAIGTVAALILADDPSEAEPLWAIRVLYGALVALPLVFGLALLSIKRAWRTPLSTTIRAVGVLAGGLYAWSLPENIPAAPDAHSMRLALLIAAAAFFVTFAPWMQRDADNGFWQFNRALFVRAVTAGLFTIVLYGGLALAMAAVENLFELHIPSERYLQLWILHLGIFLPWFFLAGVPHDLESMKQVEQYPNGLKIFSQYVLLPLVGVYLVILLAYSGKIIISWTWPYGWVSRLILGFSAAGLFSLLLLHPLRMREEARWITRAGNWFWTALLPLLVLYFLAVSRRISEYGLTEGRYLGMLVGAWLAVMALHFLFSRGKRITRIPVSLCLLALLLSFGPWSMFSVSERSQATRLEALLDQTGLLADGKIHPAGEKLPVDDAGEINAILQYLFSIHGYEAIEHWFDASLRADAAARQAWKSPEDVAALLGIDYVAVRKSHPEDDLRFDAARFTAIDVRGYDRLLPDAFFNETSREATVDAEQVRYRMNATLDTLTFVHTPEGPAAEGPAAEGPAAEGPAADSL
ncbi:MAG: DUF4153 domain-containing protein, partial [Bacteroidota bacterium]|nr:DUF4153 domain-containing protein [Bacteroidota bacterium]